jgi:hypothetical protein
VQENRPRQDKRADKQKHQRVGKRRENFPRGRDFQQNASGSAG